MNKNRRKQLSEIGEQLEAIKEQLEALCDEEQDFAAELPVVTEAVMAIVRDLPVRFNEADVQHMLAKIKEVSPALSPDTKKQQQGMLGRGRQTLANLKDGQRA